MSHFLELLDSLKQPLKRTNGHTNASVEVRSERPEDDEMTALRSQIKERENYIKKLETKTAAYGKEIVKLRAKEMELAKALSLAEVCRRGKFTAFSFMHGIRELSYRAIHLTMLGVKCLYLYWITPSAS